AEVDGGAEAIRRAVGTTPVSFRAPGYTLSPALFRGLERRGYQYDSSVFPAAPNYLAKAAVMLALRGLGRRSGAVLDSPAVLGAPLQPYLPDPDRHYRRGTSRVMERPIAVPPWARFP